MRETLKEVAFESVIEDSLTANGYVRLSPKDFDLENCIFPQTILAFIEETQPKEWAKLQKLLGEKIGSQILADLCKWMDTYGSLATLRHGFKCYGRNLRIAYFQSAHGLNPELDLRYSSNRIGVTRQLRYSSKHTKPLTSF